MRRFFLGLFLCASVAGCASTYTGIHRNEDGSFYVTRVKQGFLRVSGTLFHCTMQGQELSCNEIDSP
jgi:hypothetical protein